MKNSVPLALVFLFGFSLHADWTQVPIDDFKMLPPPKEGSKRYEKDFNVLHAWQDKRTAEECTFAQWAAFAGDANLFSMEAGLTPEEVTRALPMLRKMNRVTERITGYFKEFYQRPRPYTTDPTIKPCIFMPPGNKAYPSGHSSHATAAACLLSKMFPGHSKELKKWVDHLAEQRIVGGVHHPSDVAAGKKLGRDICKRVAKEPDFAKDIDDTLYPSAVETPPAATPPVEEEVPAEILPEAI
jgi:acid phosphatase (class A)